MVYDIVMKCQIWLSSILLRNVACLFMKNIYLYIFSLFYCVVISFGGKVTPTL